MAELPPPSPHSRVGKRAVERRVLRSSTSDVFRLWHSADTSRSLDAPSWRIFTYPYTHLYVCTYVCTCRALHARHGLPHSARDEKRVRRLRGQSMAVANRRCVEKGRRTNHVTSHTGHAIAH